jgi:hypothetical protein
VAPKAGVLAPNVLVPKAGVDAAAPKAGVLLAPKIEGVLVAVAPNAGVLVPNGLAPDAAAPPKLKPVEVAPKGDGACTARTHRHQKCRWVQGML